MWIRILVLQIALIQGLGSMVLLVESAGADEFRINTSSEGHQFVNAIEVDGNSGEFLVVWSSQTSLEDDDWDYSVQGQRYGANGLPQGGQFQVNTWTTARQFGPAAAVEPITGNVMVTWDHVQPVGTTEVDVRGRVFLSDGTPLGTDFRVNSYPSSAGYTGAGASVSALSTGDFVVVWEGVESETSDLGIQARLFQADGTPHMAQFPVPSEVGFNPNNPRVAAHDANGEFLAVWWRQTAEPQGGTEIMGRRFDSSGTPMGDGFEINVDTAATRIQPDVAFERFSQTYIVTWTERELPSGGKEDIFMRRLASDGTPLAGDMMVNTWSVGHQRSPRVAVDLAGGDFELVWYSDTTPNMAGSPNSIRGQRFSSDGTPLGDEYQVSVSGNPSSSLAVAISPSDGMASDGEPFVVWTDFATCGDGDLSGVMGSFAPVSDPCALTVDGFESGDFSAWSLVMGN